MRNSSMTVANQLAAQTDTLAGSLVGAFQPAIANAYGAKDMGRVQALAFYTCKFGTLLSLLFVLPLALELPEVLDLWLKEPPMYARGLCLFILAAHVIDRMSTGHMLAVNASVKIARYQAVLGGILIATLPIAWYLLNLGGGIYAVGMALVVTSSLCTIGRILMSRSIIGLSAQYWVKSIFFPILFLTACVLIIGMLPQMMFERSFYRVLLTTMLCVFSEITISWFFILSRRERTFIANIIEKKVIFRKGR